MYRPNISFILLSVIIQYIGFLRQGHDKKQNRSLFRKLNINLTSLNRGIFATTGTLDGFILVDTIDSYRVVIIERIRAN